MVFNPILEFLQENAHFEYKMGENEQFWTLPYADDFCLNTTYLRTHQRIINQITEKIHSMVYENQADKVQIFFNKKLKTLKYQLFYW